jgi:hypothetical protein
MILLQVVTGQPNNRANLNLAHVMEVEFRPAGELAFRMTDGKWSTVTYVSGNSDEVEKRFLLSLSPLFDARALTLMGMILKMDIADLV